MRVEISQSSVSFTLALWRIVTKARPIIQNKVLMRIFVQLICHICAKSPVAQGGWFGQDVFAKSTSAKPKPVTRGISLRVAARSALNIMNAIYLTVKTRGCHLVLISRSCAPIISSHLARSTGAGRSRPSTHSFVICTLAVTQMKSAAMKRRDLVLESHFVINTNVWITTAKICGAS